MKDNRSEQAGAGRTAPARDGRRAGTSRNASPAAVCDRTRGAQRPAQPRRRVPDTAYAPRQTAPDLHKSPQGARCPHGAPDCIILPHSRQIVVLLAAVLAVLLLITGSLLLARKVIFLEREPVAPSGDDIPNQPPETGNPITTPGSHPFADGQTGTVTFRSPQTAVSSARTASDPRARSWWICLRGRLWRPDWRTRRCTLRP